MRVSGFARVWGMLLGAALFAAGTSGPRAADPARLNVLFIVSDDLRPQLGCYGDPVVRTPNIDRLAQRAMVFNRAYAQQALCCPSRSSFMTGRRPDTTRVFDEETYFRTSLPDVVTLPEYFKEHGYHTEEISKVFHPTVDDPRSWSVPPWRPVRPTGVQQGGSGKGEEAEEELPRNSGEIPWRAEDVPDDALQDGQAAAQAVAALGRLKDRPFFLAVGFHKPHAPFIAPKKYWDLYPSDGIRLPNNIFPPHGAPACAIHPSSDFGRWNQDLRLGPRNLQEAREVVRGYLASISYMDAQVGRVLAELDRLHLAGNTAVVLIGDQGFQVGEHGMWANKHTNFETSVRAPLIVALPGRAAGRTDALVEFVDLYPSLAEMCGLPAPAGVEGTSFVPILADPGRTWKKAAFSQYPVSRFDPGRGMGYTMRTDRYRFTEWSFGSRHPRQYELYDHQTDPDENENLAVHPDRQAQVEELARELHQGWKAALPPGGGIGR